MQFLREIAQCVAQGQPFLLGCENVFALGRMIDIGVVSLWLRQCCRDTECYLFFE